MDLIPSAEQQQIVDSVRTFFAAEFPLERLRPGRREADDQGRSRWRAIGELGFFGLGLDADRGGVGYGLAEEALLFREAGRYLVSPALVAQTLAVHLAADAGFPAAAELLAGTRRAGLLVPMAGARIDREVRGDFQMFDTDAADWLVTWDEHGAALLPATSVARPRTVSCIDDAVRLARVRIDAKAAAHQGAGQTHLPQRAQLAVAAQLVGVAEAARDLATEYAKARQQFGQPIGAFQAVQHRCADMAVRTEACWALTVFAALIPTAERDDTVAAALLLATHAANDNAAGAVQVHGGMGFTADCDAQRLVKRARVLERLAGEPGALRQRLVRVAVDAA